MSNSKLIWPDVHHRRDLLIQFLKHNADQYSERYFLGDFQDQFHDTAEDAKHTAILVKELLEDPRNHIIIGNHDIDYMFPNNKSLWCPGFEISKCDAINKILTRDDWEKMSLCHCVDGWLLSHAGVHPKLLNYCGVNEFTPAAIQAACTEALNVVKDGTYHPLLLPGRDRGFRGAGPEGGITWLDWYHLKPIDGLNQVVGHTIVPAPTARYLVDGNIDGSYVQKYGHQLKRGTSTNWCIDTDNKHFAVIEDNEIYVYRTIDFL